MELPTIITNDLFALVVFVLAITPLLSGRGTFKMGQVLVSDTERPRNRVIKSMVVAGAIITLAGLFVTALCVGYIMSFLKGEAPNADFGGVTFSIVLLAMEIQPYLMWRALEALNGNAGIVNAIPETQDQREDRQFGEARRELEEEHIAANGEFDNH